MINNLLEEIKSSNPEILNQKIKSWDDLGFAQIQPFLKENRWEDSTSVNVFSVTGTQHPDYAGLPSWIKLLEVGKRMYLNLPLFKQKPEYYFEKTKKIPSMYYLCINGGEYYIGADGNHRTAIAKAAFFLEQTDGFLNGVTVNSFKADLELKKCFENINETVKKRNLPLYATIETKTVSRKDGDGWMLEKYAPAIQIQDCRKNAYIVLHNSKEAEEFLKNINASIFRRFFGFLKK